MAPANLATCPAARVPRGRFPLRPAWAALRGLTGASTPDIVSVATDSWMIAEGTPVEVRPAKFLAGQLERIRGTEFGTREEVVRDFRGGFESRQRPTMAFRLKNVLLADGVLHAEGALRHLRARAHRLPFGSPRQVIERAALYESWSGNRWFGNWLVDDCLTYRLAEAVGCPATSARSIGHMSAYEQRLGMTPLRVDASWFDELILFDDRANNAHRRWRATDLRRRLIGTERPRHAGVYLVRGVSGDRRVLQNERAIAEHLSTRLGFRVLDPSASSLAEIIDACAGARVVAGVEGSHLVHGLMLMPPEARLLVIQPPDRAVSVLKLTTDRQGQDYCFVVGRGRNEAFSADIDEIERTLDLA